MLSYRSLTHCAPSRTAVLNFFNPFPAELYSQSSFVCVMHASIVTWQSPLIKVYIEQATKAQRESSRIVYSFFNLGAG